MKILLSGGAGFIGSAFVRYIISETQDSVINLDKLTYAANLASLQSIATSPRYVFEHADIADSHRMAQLFHIHQPDVVIHLAAESHVDRSIYSPACFIQTNIIGTYTLLEAARHYWGNLDVERQARFRFLHVSTDEVYGDLGESDSGFSECSPYAPSSPYSASKAASDHLVRAWQRTYGLPTLVAHSANNYGPYQYPEKLIPLMILNALAGKPLPLYGNGMQIRDWLFVEDHVKALYGLLTKGRVGESYNISAHNPKTNLEVVHTICRLLNELSPQPQQYQDLITFVTDRPGHDVCYTMNAAKINQQLGWQPQESFETGMRKTVQWYLTNKPWWSKVLEDS